MTGWRVHAWVLMRNHHHFFIETPEANLVAGMKWLQNTYTRRFNTRHREWGRLFGDRYKSVVVEGRDRWYYETLMDYIHLNPVRVGIIRASRGESVLDYPWCSVASGYALPERLRAKWLAVKEGLAGFDLADSTEGRKKFVKRLDARAADEPGKQCGVTTSPSEDARVSDLRLGWYWGTQAFRERLLSIAEGVIKVRRNRTHRSGPVVQRHDEKEAERIVKERLKENGLRETELPGLPGTDPRKLRIAMEIRANTSVSMGWIAGWLQMRSAGNVSQQLRRLRLA